MIPAKSGLIRSHSVRTSADPEVTSADPEVTPAESEVTSGDPEVTSVESANSDAIEKGLDPALFRGAMARFPTGVAIVTTHDQRGRPHGFTASSLCSVSLDPPLVLVCLATSANCYPVFAGSPRFALSILRDQHADLARRFASKSPDKFAGAGFVRSPDGAAVLGDALAAVECTVGRRVEAGDHVIMIGRVDRVSLADEGRPAVYFDRGFAGLGSPPPAAPQP